MKKLLKGAFFATLFVVALPASAATTWDVSGNYVWNVFGSYFHDITLTQNLDGTFSGTGSWPSGGPEQTGETITGTVTGNQIAYTVTYTGPYAIGSVFNMTGTIDETGFISGTVPWNWQFDNGVATLLPVDFSVVPWIYDPETTELAVSEWTYEDPELALDKEICKNDGWKTEQLFGEAHPPTFKNQGKCVSYADNWNSNLEQVLNLQKNTVTSGNVAAGAELVGEEGIILTELGFDYKGYCGAGAPRFNVDTTAGTYYFFGCTYGTHTAVADGWTQVRFANADAYPADGTTVFPGFGNTEVLGIDIVMDEAGQTMLDNIDVNGSIVGQE